MNTNEIKKEIFKQKPVAEFAHTSDGCKIYSCELIVEGVEEEIEFKIPFSDGAAMFEDKIEAQLLIRWLV